MHKLKALTPLNNDQLAFDRFEGITLREENDLSLAMLMKHSGTDKDFHALAKNILKVDFPKVSKSVTQGERVIRWIRSDTWLIEAPYIGHGKLESEIKDLFGNAVAVVEQSDAFCLFDIEGLKCTEVLARLCNVDTGKMKKGDISATQLEHLNCFIVCKKEGQQYRIMGPRSAAISIQHAIISAIKSIT